jgi:ParB family chromosome partitioning protein
MGQLRTVPIAEIRENPVALRTVNRQAEDYLGLVESIRNKGFLGAVTVREKSDPETEESFFELVDGLHRFAAAKDAGLTEINVDIVDLSDSETLEAQIMANIHKVETRPVEYSQQLRRILTQNPLMMEAELASKLGKSTQWIKERLGLTKIQNDEIKALIDEGKIGLANAYALAKLPPEEQADFVDRAMTLPPDEFVPVANKRVKEIREAKRKGEDAKPKEFQPVAFMQKMKEIKDAVDSGDIAKALISDLKIKTPYDAFQMALNWVLHLDPKSVEIQKQKDVERREERAASKKKREAERADKKAEEAKVKAKEAADAAEKAKSALAGTPT